MKDNRPQLTYVISSLKMGGAERGMARLINRLVIDYNTTVVALQGGDQAIVDELPSEASIFDLGVKSFCDVGRLRYLWQELIETDVLICSLYHAAVIGTVLGRAAEVPLVITWQHNQSFATRRRQRVFRLAARLSDRVLADSKAVAAMLDQKYNLPDRKVKTIPIAGININRFAPQNQSTSHMMASEDNSDCLTTVGILGRLLKQKNHKAVLKAANRVADEPIQFEIAGEGPRESSLHNLAQEWELSNVRFRGFVEDAPSFLNELDVYVQPSHYEGLCLTVLEAMACELPVIGAAVGGMTETIIHGETGYLFDPNDMNVFVSHIRELHESSELRRQMGQQARQRVVEQYSTTIFHNRFMTLLNDVDS